MPHCARDPHHTRMCYPYILRICGHFWPFILDREPSYWCTCDTSFWVDDSRLSITWRFTNSTSFQLKTRIRSAKTLKNRFLSKYPVKNRYFTDILADVLRTGSSISPEPSLSKDQKPIAPPNVQKTPNQTDNTPEKTPQPGKLFGSRSKWAVILKVLTRKGRRTIVPLSVVWAVQNGVQITIIGPYTFTCHFSDSRSNSHMGSTSP